MDGVIRSGVPAFRFQTLARANALAALHECIEQGRDGSDEDSMLVAAGRECLCQDLPMIIDRIAGTKHKFRRTDQVIQVLHLTKSEYERMSGAARGLRVSRDMARPVDGRAIAECSPKRTEVVHSTVTIQKCMIVPCCASDGRPSGDLPYLIQMGSVTEMATECPEVIQSTILVQKSMRLAAWSNRRPGDLTVSVRRGPS